MRTHAVVLLSTLTLTASAHARPFAPPRASARQTTNVGTIAHRDAKKEVAAFTHRKISLLAMTARERPIIKTKAGAVAAKLGLE